MLRLSLALLAVGAARGFAPSASYRARGVARAADALAEGAGPVDVDAAEVLPDDAPERRDALRSALLRLAASTNRGEAASEAERRSAASLCEGLEALNPMPRPAAAFPELAGTWELLYASTQLFRSSPFFMAGRAVCAEGAQAERYDWFCEMHRAALAVSTIGKVRQIVSSDRLVSEFETTAGAVPGAAGAIALANTFEALPFVVSGAIVTTAALTVCDAPASEWELALRGVEVKGSNVPGLRQLLDGGLSLDSKALGETLESAVPSYHNPRPRFATTFLDDDLRISRDQDGKIFVYARVSASTEPTDYSARPADLGAGKIWDGFSRAFLGQ